MPRRPIGWSNRKRATFLEVLRSTGNISAAARVVGMPRASLYDLRRQDNTFRREWVRARVRRRVAEVELGGAPTARHGLS